MLVESVVTFAAVVLGFLFWLKSKLPAVDSKTAQLQQHLQQYTDEDLDYDEKELKVIRMSKYKEVTENYYNLSTDLLHIIWGPHYSTGLLFPVENHKWQTYAACQQMYQCYLALALQVDETMTIGDFGCGTGGPTRCIAQFTGAKIKAVNITARHLDQMVGWNQQEHIDHCIDPVAADYHHTPFADNSLDGVYMMESLGHSPDYKLLCKEVYRVLKPGARFTGFNWDLTDKFDESNPDHRRIRILIERGVGMAKMSKISDLTTAMREAGFEIIKQRDHNEFGMKLGAKPWHFLLDEKSSLTSFLGPVFFLVSASTKAIFAGLWVLEKLRMVAPGTSKAYTTVMVSLHDGMKEGIEQEIFTPMHFWLAKKPDNAKK